jgi:hypothetical protein
MRPILQSLRHGASALMRSLRDRLGRGASLLRMLSLGLLALILVVILADLSAFLRLPFYPFATKGAIYVDSPEVYTRERLVNDRYDQDHWLRRRLDDLDHADNLLTGSATTRRAAGVAFGEAGAPADGGPATSAPAGGELELPFDQEFRIRAATRDMIRQMVLENMLDDRHDLTGNSMYGLKFDTTVIPGTNTVQRAFVRVAIDVEPLLAGQGGSVDGLESHVRQFFDLGFGRIKDRDDNPLFKPFDLYERWLESIDFRLNNYLSVLDDLERAAPDLADVKPDTPAARSACTAGADQQALLHDTTWTMLEAVLGIDQRRALASGGSAATDTIALPKPWVDFLVLHRYGDLCAEDIHFVVEPLFEPIYVFPAEGDPVAAGYFPVSGTASGEQVAVHNPYGRPPQTQDEFEAIKPKYDITGSLVAYARGKNQLFAGCARQSSGKDPCAAPVEMVTVPSGFFNFVEQIIKTDAYSYAIFPKNDLIGLIADDTRSTSLQERIGGDGGVGAWLELVQAMRAASTRSVAVGFGDQSSAADRRVEFGWVIANEGGTQPVQKAQLALVSVPAWSSELNIDVTTGWLDRNSTEHAVQTVEIVVPLPPEYEAFDSYVGRSQLRRQPKILNDFLDEDITVTACREAEILIPGFRLWRSTSVTLGAQQADRIRVLPNMQGIVASFAPVDMPSRLIEGGGADVQLRVWTSEGMDVAEKPVRIRLPDGAAYDRCPLERPPTEESASFSVAN